MFRCDQKSSSVVPLRAIQRHPTTESIYSRVIEYKRYCCIVLWHLMVQLAGILEIRFSK